jgi:hypothetical protein
MFKVFDGQEYSSSSYMLTVNVNPVNDPPTSTNSVIDMNEDTEFKFAYTNFGDFKDIDDPNAKLSAIRIRTKPLRGTLLFNGRDIAINQVVTKEQLTDGRLVYKPAPDGYGMNYTSFNFDVSDGIVFSNKSYTLFVNVHEVNDVPSSSNDSIELDEDTTYALGINDFGNFFDRDNDSFEGVKITALPTKGSLLLNGNPVSNGQSISVSDISSKRLTYTPLENEYGDKYTTLKFKVFDGTDYSVTDNILNINVNPVNDPPTSTDDSIEIDKNTTYAFKTDDFGTYADID